MTITTYYATHSLGQRHHEADAIVHQINDLTAASGDNRSWDATRAQLDHVADPQTQARLGIRIEAEQFEHMGDEH
jgi:hypothetical protein